MPSTALLSRPPRSSRRLAIAVLLVVVAAFLILELPAYLGFDPAASRVPVRADYPLPITRCWSRTSCSARSRW